jgi:hypothetical protein
MIQDVARPPDLAATGRVDASGVAGDELGDGQWVSISQAAALVQVSVDTIRRRIRTEQITWKRDGRGHYMVEVPTALAPPSRRPRDEATAGLLVRLRNCAALLSEIRTQRDQLLEQVEAQQRLLEAHARAEADLRQLLLASRS